MFNTVVAILCLAVSTFYSAVAESLRNFFRSRLAFVCRLQKNEERFGIILRDDEDALRVVEAVQSFTLVLALFLFAIERYRTTPVVTQTMFWSDLILATISIWIIIRVIPWALSRVVAEHVVYHSWPVIEVTMFLGQPIILAGKRIDTFVHRMAGRQDPAPETYETLTEEIQSVVDEGEREGILESRAGKMIHRVMELRQQDVRAVMTPRTDIVTIQVSASFDEARQQLLEAGHSRVPVVDGSTDEIIGILYARDLLEYFGNSVENTSLREIVRDAFYIPETNTIDALLNRMKQDRLHLAIVLDEYGGVTGLVTLEDILEEIVGDIADEFDELEDERIEWLDAHTIVVDARMHIDEMNDLFDLDLPEDRDFDTLGGLVFSTLERVPVAGERFDWNGIQFTVIEATERKIIRLQLYSPVAWPRTDLGQINDEILNADQTASFRLIRDESTTDNETPEDSAAQDTNSEERA